MLEDPLNLLRVAVMLTFMAGWLGLVAWLLRPGARRSGVAAAQIPFRDDTQPGGNS